MGFPIIYTSFFLWKGKKSIAVARELSKATTMDRNAESNGQKVLFIARIGFVDGDYGKIFAV